MLKEGDLIKFYSSIRDKRFTCKGHIDRIIDDKNIVLEFSKTKGIKGHKSTIHISKIISVNNDKYDFNKKE